jgi:hypothetical protein
MIFLQLLSESITMKPHRRPLPLAPLPLPAQDAFGLLPLASLGLQQLEGWQLAIYERAFAEAQGVVRRGIPERDILAVWN